MVPHQNNTLELALVLNGPWRELCQCPLSDRLPAYAEGCEWDQWKVKEQTLNILLCPYTGLLINIGSLLAQSVLAQLLTNYWLITH